MSVGGLKSLYVFLTFSYGVYSKRAPNPQRFNYKLGEGTFYLLVRLSFRTVDGLATGVPQVSLLDDFEGKVIPLNEG